MSTVLPSADKYERMVAKLLRLHASHNKAKGYTFEVTGKRSVAGSADDEYEIDATATLESVMGTEIRFLIECKCHVRPVARDFVMTLWAKLQVTGSHKGIMFSASGFQAGAIKYAQLVGIALIQYAKGEWVRVAKSRDAPPSADDDRGEAILLCDETDTGGFRQLLLDADTIGELDAYWSRE